MYIEALITDQNVDFAVESENPAEIQMCTDNSQGIKPAVFNIQKIYPGI